MKEASPYSVALMTGDIKTKFDVFAAVKHSISAV
jgi:hypothetical protein